MSSRANAGIAFLGDCNRSKPHPEPIFADSQFPHSAGSEAQSERARVASLTNSEREIISLIAYGLKDRQIAARLDQREAIVEHRVKCISEKLACLDRLELVVYAYWQGLV